MASSRVIRCGFVDSDRVAQLDFAAECVLHRLLLVVDNYGRFDARPGILLNALFPVHAVRMTVQEMQAALDRIAQAGIIELYEVGGKPYLQIPNFGQRGKSKSKYPDPERATPCNTVQHGATPCNTVQHGATPCNTVQHGATPCNTVQHGATSIENQDISSCYTDTAADTGQEKEKAAPSFPPHTPPYYPPEKEKEYACTTNHKGQYTIGETDAKGLQQEQDLSGLFSWQSVTGRVDTSPPPPSLPKDSREVHDFLLSQRERPRSDMELTYCAESFFDTFAARGWKDARGVKVQDWKAAARNYCRSWCNNTRRNTTTPSNERNDNLNANRRYQL